LQRCRRQGRSPCEARPWEAPTADQRVSLLSVLLSLGRTVRGDADLVLLGGPDKSVFFSARRPLSLGSLLSFGRRAASYAPIFAQKCAFLVSRYRPFSAWRHRSRCWSRPRSPARVRGSLVVSACATLACSADSPSRSMRASSVARAVVAS